MIGDTLEVYSADDWLQLVDCDSVFGSLLIQDWDVSNLDGLAELVWIEEHLILNENISLLNDDGLANLEHVGGNLMFSSNFTLQSINSLNSVEYVGGSLMFEGNITLVDISSFENIDLIAGDLIVRENHTLAVLDGFNSLTDIEGDLILDHQNLVLNDFTGLSQLENIGGDLLIELPEAFHLEGFTALAQVSGDFELRDMPLLGNVNGIEALTSIGGSLKIFDNGSLVQVDGLTMLNSIGGNLEVHDNPSLFWCCGLENVLVNGSISGTVDLSNNSSSCESEVIILENCQEGIEDQIPDFKLLMSENGGQLSSSAYFTCRLIASDGTTKAQQTVGTQNWNFGDLIAGLYLLEIDWSAGQRTVEKVMICR
jgi:hypothetical protein